MRIVAGEFKGRKLETPENYQIRPTSEKVKEAVFSMIAGKVPGSVCVDLFSGTGNIGLEAISRGAAKCYFCDNSKVSVGITKRNISTCKAEDRAVVILGDYEKGLSMISERQSKIDIVFLDPPYKEGLYERCFEMISNLDLLSDGGVIIAEHHSKDIFPENISGYVKIKEKKYGSIGISIYS